MRERREIETEDNTDASLDQGPTLAFSSWLLSLFIDNAAVPKPLSQRRPPAALLTNARGLLDHTVFTERVTAYLIAQCC